MPNRKLNPKWPVLTSYTGEKRKQVAMPIGGIGTGTVSIGGRGELRDWEVMSRPAKGYNPSNWFFALYAKSPGKASVTRALEGALQPPFEGSIGSTEPNHGLPRFRDCEFHAAYPFAQVLLSDPDVPLDVRIESFNPLIPGDADRSSLPCAILRFVLRNRTSKPVTASVCGSASNFIGHDGKEGKIAGGRIRYRNRDGLTGLMLSSDGVHPALEQAGTLSLVTPAGSGVTHTTGWPSRGKAQNIRTAGLRLENFWDDFSADGRLTQRSERGVDDPHGSVAVSLTVPARAEKSVTFLVAWHFPNRMSWSPDGPLEGLRDHRKNRVGNHYALGFRDAWAAAASVAGDLSRLESDTLAFVSNFLASDLPHEFKEAALYNISTLRTQTTIRIDSGHLMGWEGTHANEGCCFGSCTHVWNYETTTPFLFGDLARTMREVEFLYATRNTGHMTFRTTLPLKTANKRHHMAAADGQMGCLMKLYREWQLHGDDAWLRKVWPRARKALAFCWIPGGWDADQDGVMEGAQHNTMDVNYFGPNPQMACWYLGALLAAERIATHLGDKAFAEKCSALRASGSRWVDKNLFNGEYYEHEIRPLKKGQEIAPGLHLNVFDPKERAKASNPPNQLGAGCLIDQLVGQYMAHVLGFGYLLNQSKVRKTLRSILKYNQLENFYDHLNTMRSYVLSDESAVLMCSYPRGNRPATSFPYWTEVMTGFEHQLAAHLVYEGQDKLGREIVKAIRDRYDGARRNPFNEAECGNHYARAMAAWSEVLAWTGFRYSAVTKTVTFGRRPGLHFWSSGYAWGTCRIKKGKGGTSVALKVLFGKLKLRHIEVTGVGAKTLPRVKTLSRGGSLRLTVKP